jgi:hypothetical protein
MSTQWMEVPGLLQIPGIRGESCVIARMEKGFPMDPRSARQTKNCRWGAAYEREGYSFWSQFEILRGRINYIPQPSQPSSC